MRRRGREGIGLLIQEGSCASLSLPHPFPFALSLSDSPAPSLVPWPLLLVYTFDLCIRCVRMFMPVQETRVRGYANRMIDTLAGRLPSLALSFIPLGELISSRVGRNAPRVAEGACNESRIFHSPL